MKEGIYTGASEKDFKSKREIEIENLDKPEFLTPLPSAKNFKYWSERLQQRQEEYQEAKIGLNSVEIRLPETSSVCFMSDLHIGGADVNYKRIEQEVLSILQTPNSYVVMLGDAVDGFFFNPAEMEQIEQVPEQYEYIQAMFKALGKEKKVLAGLSGDHDCLDEETEVFTKEDGWINYKDLNQDHHLLTIGKSLEWHKYERKIVEHYTGKMYKYSSIMFDILCTPNHRIYYQKRRTNKYDFLNVRDFANKKAMDHLMIPTADSFNYKDIDISDNMLYLIGFLIGDGSIDKHGYITFYQSKKENLKRLLTALDKENIKYKITERKRFREEIDGMKVKKLQQAYEVILNAFESKKLDKYINIKNKKLLKEYLWKLSDKQFKAFLKGLVDSDGTIPKQSINSCVFYQKDKDLIDDIQTLCIMHGYRASIYPYKNRMGSNQYRLNITNKNRLRLGKRFEIVDYDGMIWDVSIPPNRNFLVRRNGKAYFTGNSWAKKMGLSAYTQFSEQTGGALLEGVAYMTIRIGNQEYKITMAHRLPGSSIYNRNHPQMRLAKFGSGFGSDIIVSGHNHQKQIAQSTQSGFGGETNKINYVALGAYKSTDDYAKKLGFSQQQPEEMFGVSVHLSKDIKRVRVFDSILEGNNEL